MTNPSPADVREALAPGRLLYEAFWKRQTGGLRVAWCDQSSAIRNMWDAIADDAAALPSLGFVAGWRLVPEELTEAMKVAGAKNLAFGQGDPEEEFTSWRTDAVCCYAAMLAAAPTPPAQEADHGR